MGVVEIEKWKRDKEVAREPDPEYQVVSFEGGRAVKYYNYGFHFTHDGQLCCFDLWATSFEDAEAKLESLKKTAVLAGRNMASVPA